MAGGARADSDIDGIALPAGWRLGYAVEQHGENNPNLNELKKRIRTWAEEAVEAGPESMPQRIFEAVDYKIELTLFGGFDPADGV